MKITQLIENFFSYFGNIRVMDILDILVVTILFYFVIIWIRKYNSSKLFMGVVFLFLFQWISYEAKLYTLNYIFKNTVQTGLIALVVIFQPEIRRFLERMGTGTSFRRLFDGNHAVTSVNALRQTVLACLDMSLSKTGALIVFERKNSLDEQVRSGTVLNADISAELLKNIFFDKAPLHDGAVIIRDGRILAAGCMLPLTSASGLSRDLGMRHRAGIGMSEQSDAIVVLVSEETGNLSIATGGMLKRRLGREIFEKVLRNELIPEEMPVRKKFSFFKKRKQEGKRDE